MTEISINLRGTDLLRQWKTQINTLSVSESGHKTGQVPNFKKIKLVQEFYQRQLQSVDAVYKQNIEGAGNSIGYQVATADKRPTALQLRWLTEQPIWIVQWTMIKNQIKTKTKTTVTTTTKSIGSRKDSQGTAVGSEYIGVYQPLEFSGICH